ncbi:MAG TPA: PA domain-containing protein [Pyrinomonadaceae bacterium]|nr:PA domain-containing protein [Pyrinomonadaceae bacterium]
MLAKISKLPLIATVLLVFGGAAFGQANIVIQNADGAGVGFNDPTLASPVGGNSGTTIGQQRLNVFQTAASIWGTALRTTQTITVNAHWAAMTCTATSGTLGAAGPDSTAATSSPNQPLVQNRWYPVALAEALTNTNRNASSPEIDATFNLSVGTSGCLSGASWYYGLDNNHGTTGIDLLTVVLHEFGHGLGFLTFTSVSSGAFLGMAPNNFPSIWDDFLFDDTAGKTWSQMATDQERAASAKKYGNLLWSGPQVNADVPAAVLSVVPRFRVISPLTIAANYQIGFANFGPSPSISPAGIKAPLVQAIPNDACTAVSSLAGKIALIDRGTCSFVSKVHNAQNAGALGVIVVDNVSNPTPPGMGGGPDNTITIPTFSITLADGNTIKAQLGAGVNATFVSDKRPFLYTPANVTSGSSVSHWDTALMPNQLMEPNNSDDLTHSVRTPQDLTLSLLSDIGWLVNPNLAPTILIEQGTANTASALDSVTFERGPFTVLTSHNFSADGRRRLIIFTTPVLPANPNISVTANGILLTAENFGTFNALAGTSYIVVALPNLAGGDTTYALSVTVNGIASTNTPTITIQ